MTSAIIVAAGRGIRMGANVDKLWLEVAGRPVIAHTWQRFNDAPCIGEIILVVRDGMQSEFTELAARFHFQKPFRLAVGGAERQDSVCNGLAALAPERKIDWSDSWSDEDLREFRAASVRRLEEIESEEAG